MIKQKEPEHPTPHGFRRTVAVAKVGEQGLRQTITATPSELARVATYLGLVGIETLSAEVNLTRWRAKGVRVVGSLRADVTQSCVVTLDPVAAHVEGEFERRFLPGAEEEDVDVFVEPDGEDPPEPLGREIDIGEILVEELSLNLDPYPRKPGAEIEAAAVAPDLATPRENPFAKLAKLKSKLEKK